MFRSAKRCCTARTFSVEILIGLTLQSHVIRAVLSAKPQQNLSQHSEEKRCFMIPNLEGMQHYHLMEAVVTKLMLFLTNLIMTPI